MWALEQNDQDASSPAGWAIGRLANAVQASGDDADLHQSEQAGRRSIEDQWTVDRIYNSQQRSIRSAGKEMQAKTKRL
jgi:hypothetical protein